ncbi:MAG: transglutaminase family protein [Nitriliruptorales bacterium]
MYGAYHERLTAMVRDPACDLAEAALLCCAEAQPDLDVDATLRNIDALAQGLRASGFQPQSRYGRGRGGTSEAATADAHELADYLATRLGFGGDMNAEHDPRNSLLTAVLDRRLGTATTLGILYIAVGRRLALRVFGTDTPGRLLVGVGGGAPATGATRPAVIDPFHQGAILDDAMLDEHVLSETAGQTSYQPAMLRPVPPTVIIGELLDDLIHGYLAQGDGGTALRMTELKRLLPGSGPDDVLVAGQLLALLGRYRESAETLEGYLTEVAGEFDLAAAAGGPALGAMARVARRARAKMN